MSQIEFPFQRVFTFAEDNFDDLLELNFAYLLIRWYVVMLYPENKSFSSSTRSLRGDFICSHEKLGYDEVVAFYRILVPRS